MCLEVIYPCLNIIILIIFAIAIVDCEWKEKSSTICSASCGYGGLKIVLKTKIVEESENGYCEKPGPVGTVRNFVEDCFLTECPGKSYALIIRTSYH